MRARVLFRRKPAVIAGAGHRRQDAGHRRQNAGQVPLDAVWHRLTLFDTA